MCIEIMSDFTCNLRQQDASRDIPNISQEQMAIYQSLIYNNINNTLKRTFPVSVSILSKAQWRTLTLGFLADYGSESPYFYDLPKQFVNYLNTLKVLPLPFLYELMHYEWIELDVELSIDRERQNLSDNYITNNSTRVLVYRYPVHQISKDFIPEQPPVNPTFLVVYRNSAFKVLFMEVNLLSAHLLELLITEPQSIDQAITTAAHNLSLPVSEDLLQSGRALCQSYIEKNILIPV
ncbi:HvfC family RiPP maturation protein [Cysteiniphilum halobium]|uniref:HvfC family RiPP maturation protein n=1 Tax=Cysteiniphilum halobium TaxID=2219059 RepID=UPI003F867CF0